jgi:hypothetical protein
MSTYNHYFYQENLKESYKTSSTLRDGYGAQDLRHCPKGHSWVVGREGGARERGEEKEESSSAARGSKKNGYFKFIKVDLLRSSFKFLGPKI